MTTFHGGHTLVDEGAVVTALAEVLFLEETSVRGVALAGHQALPLDLGRLPPGAHLHVLTPFDDVLAQQQRRVRIVIRRPADVAF